ncbi:MAG: HNH endonuclease, partial [Mycolicibacterium neoaurum]|uniref:HNH endonuclease n=1 Tax=Mycolicibacterium neoaurum TaxID=1795 RepID=UPI002FF8CBB8
AAAVELRVDHVVPEALGGSDDPLNLVTACEPCNSGKSSVPLDAQTVADVAGDAERWAAAMRQAASEITTESEQFDAILEEVARHWGRYMPDGWEGSVVVFIRAGLDPADLLALIDVALRAKGVNDRWAYFCGCCWKRIRKIQERASEIVGREPVEPAPAASTVLTTQWEQDEVDEVVARAVDLAREYLSAEEIAYAACKHQESGYCTGDPVCAIQCATTLEWLAINYGNEDARVSLRDFAVMDEAELLEVL